MSFFLRIVAILVGWINFVHGHDYLIDMGNITHIGRRAWGRIICDRWRGVPLGLCNVRSETSKAGTKKSPARGEPSAGQVACGWPRWSGSRLSRLPLGCPHISICANRQKCGVQARPLSARASPFRLGRRRPFSRRDTGPTCAHSRKSVLDAPPAVTSACRPASERKSL